MRSHMRGKQTRLRLWQALQMGTTIGFWNLIMGASEVITALLRKMLPYQKKLNTAARTVQHNVVVVTLRLQDFRVEKNTNIA